jgi:hypothetical protein
VSSLTNHEMLVACFAPPRRHHIWEIGRIVSATAQTTPDPGFPFRPLPQAKPDSILSGYEPNEAKALRGAVRKAVPALGKEAKGALGVFDAALSTWGMAMVLGADERSWHAILDSGIDAAKDLAGVLKVAHPSIANNMFFGFFDVSATLAGELSRLHTAVTAKEQPLPRRGSAI